MMSISQSVFVPQVVCTSADESYAGILLDTRIACCMKSIIHSPLAETSAQFCAASVVLALEGLHKVCLTENSDFLLETLPCVNSAFVIGIHISDRNSVSRSVP